LDFWAGRRQHRHQDRISNFQRRRYPSFWILKSSRCFGHYLATVSNRSEFKFPIQIAHFTAKSRISNFKPKKRMTMEISDELGMKFIPFQSQFGRSRASFLAKPSSALVAQREREKGRKSAAGNVQRDEKTKSDHEIFSLCPLFLLSCRHHEITTAVEEKQVQQEGVAAGKRALPSRDPHHRRVVTKEAVDVRCHIPRTTDKPTECVQNQNDFLEQLSDKSTDLILI
jgi:hypothetical protein